MLPSYDDIRDKISEEPKWFDKHGVPRYCEFHPKRLGVYAQDVALIEIACQYCFTKFRVGMDYDAIDIHMRTEYNRPTTGAIGSFHYGDPPIHRDLEGICVGCTMNVISLRVLEFWQSPKYTDGNWEWTRVPEHEVEIENLDEYTNDNS